MKPLLSVIALCLFVGEAAAAPMSAAFQGVVGDEADLALVIPGVSAGDPISIEFRYDDGAVDASPISFLIGSYSGAGGLFGANLTIGSHELASDSVEIQIFALPGTTDQVGFRTDVEIDGVVSAFWVFLIDPTGSVLAGDSLTGIQPLEAFPAPALFRVTEVGRVDPEVFYSGAIRLVPEPGPAVLLGIAALMVGKTRRRPA